MCDHRARRFSQPAPTSDAASRTSTWRQERSRRKSREDVRGEEGTAAVGRDRAAIAAGHRGPAEERWCKHAAKSLGVLPVGSTRQFCNRPHAKAWHWANDRDKLIEAMRGPGEERSCRYCGRALGWVPGTSSTRPRPSAGIAARCSGNGSKLYPAYAASAQGARSRARAAGRRRVPAPVTDRHRVLRELQQ